MSPTLLYCLDYRPEYRKTTEGLTVVAIVRAECPGATELMHASPVVLDEHLQFVKNIRPDGHYVVSPEKAVQVVAKFLLALSIVVAPKG